MASTWNRALLEQAGRVLGRETRAVGCSVLLGPMINLHRLPINGRSYETFSEDPWLAGMLGAAVIRGIQAEGVAACVKAMAANSQQKHQEAISSDASELTLRELYLRVFELAIEEGQPAAVMTSYNKINGTYPSEDLWLLRDVIKGAWKFPGMIVSDWRAVHSSRALIAGLDIEMPGPGKHLHAEGVLRAIGTGAYSEELLDDNVRRILRLLLDYGQPDSPAPGLDSPENRATAMAVAEESIVLLKNDDALLPIDLAAVGRILVVGPNAAHARLGGGGSASVTPFYSISPLDGIRELHDDVQYIEGCSLVGTMQPIADALHHVDESGELRPGLLAEYFNHDADQNLVGPVLRAHEQQVDFSWGWASPGTGVDRDRYTARFTGFIMPAASGVHRVGVFAQEGVVRLTLAGRTVVDTMAEAATMSHENFETDYRTTYHVEPIDLVAGELVAVELEYEKRVARAAVRLEWETPGMQPSEQLRAAAAAADVVIVCAGLSNLFEGGGNDRSEIGLPQAQQDLINMMAAVNRRTVVVLFNGGPVAMPWETRVPAILEAWYPGQEGGRALARLLFGLADPSGRLPDSLVRQLDDHASIANYPGDGLSAPFTEGMFIGYRHLDAAGIEPHFPFGYGLGYTSFAVDAPRIHVTSADARQPSASVEVDVRNVGDRDGAHVVQLYLRRVDGAADRPGNELRGFEKLTVPAGGQAIVRFHLGQREFETWDDASRAWHIAAGDYDVLVGNHSRDLKSTRLRLV